MSGDILTLTRLIGLRRNTLEELRRDLATLDHLVGECRQRLERVLLGHADFAEEIRCAETGLSLPEQMLARRRYLAYLQTLVEQAAASLDAATEQQDRARAAFDECYQDIRTLERVAERRSRLHQQEAQRKQYLLADDQEIMRHGRNRKEEHGLH